MTLQYHNKTTTWQTVILRGWSHYCKELSTVRQSSCIDTGYFHELSEDISVSLITALQSISTECWMAPL